jgi:multiple antibiotic resistance protein
MVETFQFALLALSAIFVIVDPLGVVPLFLALTPNDSAERKRAMARRACLVAGSLLVLFAVAGNSLLQLFGITLSAFKVAGGLLMLLTAIDQLRAQPTPTRTTSEETHEGAAKEDVSIVPLAVPLLAGPGSIATTMMLMSRAKGLVQSALVLVAIALTIGAAYVLLRSSDTISRHLGTTVRLVVERIIGLVLAAIAVQFILDGMVEVMRSASS